MGLVTGKKVFSIMALCAMVEPSPASRGHVASLAGCR